MGETSEIEWTDATWRADEATLDQPLRWKRPRRIFVCAHGDLFHEAVPDAWIDRVFAMMALAPQHTFQVLTKRPERMRAYVAAHGRWDAVSDHAFELMQVMRGHDAAEEWWRSDPIWPLRNVWLGVSAEDQATADARIPHLLATPAAVRFVSAEPLLGAMDLTSIPKMLRGGYLEVDALTGIETMEPLVPEPFRGTRLDWVIVGGESGKGARPMHPDWGRALRDQCAAAGVPFFMKQLSSGGPKAIKEIDSFPEGLRVREFPA